MTTSTIPPLISRLNPPLTLRVDMTRRARHSFHVGFEAVFIGGFGVFVMFIIAAVSW